ncbi:MAG: hypothetical protein WDO13_03585 [Verrucomicrobiota bacterium]
MAMRLLPRALGALLLLSAPLSLRAEENEAPNATDGEVYKAPTGEAPPVAPPLRKGSPLDHLANDPKYTSLAVGYKEGNTKGDTYWDRPPAHRPRRRPGLGLGAPARTQLERGDVDRAAGDARPRRRTAPPSAEGRHGRELGVQVLGPLRRLQGLRSAA